MVRDRAERNKLVLDHIALVDAAVERAKNTLPACVERGDLRSAGMIGLLQAADRFDPDRGATFASYAHYRVRGAISDYLRTQDIVPRTVRARASRLSRAEEAVRSRTGRAPGLRALAREIGIPATKCLAWQRDAREAQSFAIHSLEALRSDRSEDGDVDWSQLIQDAGAALGPQGVDDADELQHSLSGLTDVERRVMCLYYSGETMRHIGTVIGVSESRVCQIHREALRWLQRGRKA